MATNPVSQLAKIVRSRAKHFYGLPIGVKQKGSSLTLSVSDKRTGARETETFEVDVNELAELFHYDDAPTDYADSLINKFMFPVKSLM